MQSPICTLLKLLEPVCGTEYVQRGFRESKEKGMRVYKYPQHMVQAQQSSLVSGFSVLPNIFHC